jgi:hypothetical protein
MSNIVAITPNGSIIKGIYDGYGNLNGGAEVEAPAMAEADVTVWHAACWSHAGSPQEYRGPSPGSADQGWFFEEGDHDMPEPQPTPDAPTDSERWVVRAFSRDVTNPTDDEAVAWYVQDTRLGYCTEPFARKGTAERAARARNREERDRK